MDDKQSGERARERGDLMPVVILVLGTFAVGTDAFIVAGFLPSLAASLHVSVGVAGQSVTVFAITYAVFAPILATLAAKVPRRKLLVAALVVIAGANLGTAVAADFTVLMAFRTLAALGAAAYTPTAGAVAAWLAPSALRGRALALVLAGLTLATVLSVPAGDLISDWASWRAALGLVAGLAFLSSVAVLRILPVLGGGPFVPLRDRLAVLRKPGVVSILPLTVLGMAASYAVYAYSVPALRGVGVAPGAIGGFLFLYGLGAVLGSALCGYVTDRWGAVRMLSATYSVMTLALGLLGCLALHAPSRGIISTAVVGLLVSLWGASTWSQTPPQQHRLIAAAPESVSLVLSLNASAIYLGIGSGTALGGVALTAGVPVLYGVATVIAALTGLYLIGTLRRYRV